MKKSFLAALSLSFLIVPAAHAENNGLEYDAKAKGYSFSISEVAFGAGSLTMSDSDASVRIVMSSPLKNGKGIEMAGHDANGDDTKITAQTTQICNDMFGTPDRIAKFKIEGSDYLSTGRYFNSIGCIISSK